MASLNSTSFKKSKPYKYLNQNLYQIINRKIKISRTSTNSLHHLKNLKIILIQSKVSTSLFKTYKKKLVKLLESK